MVSPRFALARDLSGLLFLAAADSFPTLVFCCGEGNEGMMGRVSVWVWACVHLCVWVHVERADHCSSWRWMKSPHILLWAGVWEGMEIWWWYSSLLTHITSPVTTVIIKGQKLAWKEYVIACYLHQGGYVFGSVCFVGFGCLVVGRIKENYSTKFSWKLVEECSMDGTRKNPLDFVADLNHWADTRITFHFRWHCKIGRLALAE